MNPTFRVSSGLIDPKHLRKMGAGLKVFLWCVDRQTDSEGSVLHGRSVKISRIAKSIGICIRTAKTHLSRLISAGYLGAVRTGRGLRITVLNQKKWRLPEVPEVAPQKCKNLHLGKTAEVQETAPLIKHGRAREDLDLHLKRSQGRDLQAREQSDRAPALSIPLAQPRTAQALAYYSPEDLALMPPAERALVDRLTDPGYDALAEGDCARCHTGPRVRGALCLDCAPRLVLAKDGTA